MKLVDFAKRRSDGLIDQHWVEGFEAYKLHAAPDACPYDDTSDQFNNWVEGWMDAAYFLTFSTQELHRPRLPGSLHLPVRVRSGAFSGASSNNYGSEKDEGFAT